MEVVMWASYCKVRNSRNKKYKLLSINNRLESKISKKQEVFLASTKKQYAPRLLDTFPESKDIICRWAIENLSTLTCERQKMSFTELWTLRDNMSEFNMWATTVRDEHMQNIELLDLFLDDIPDQVSGKCKAIIAVLSTQQRQKIFL